MRFHIDQPPRPRNRRVIRRHLVQSHAQKTAQPQRIRRPPRNPPFAVDALEISNQQQAEIPPRRQTGPPHLLRVEARTLLLHVLVKTALLQQPVQLLVERMPHRPRQIRVRDPKFLLSSLLLSSAHSHARILRISAVDHTSFFSRNPDFHHGLLVLLCYKCGAPQKGQLESCRSRTRAMVCRSVAIDQGLCRSRRTRRSPR